MKKKIIHRSPTQVIYEDGTSKRFNKAIKIPVRDEDVEAFREEMRLNGALEFMDGYDYGRVEEIKKVDLWLKNTINILIVLSAGFLLGTLLIMIFK